MATADPMQPLLAVGTEVAGYRIEAFLSRGGMAVVYRAHDRRLGRRVALKLLAPELSHNERFQQRFLRESRLAASLDHPNIIPIYEAGEADGLLYIVMRYVEGSDLQAVLDRDGPLELPRLASILGQVGAALDAAHARGLVHRDVKPGNILIASGAGREAPDHVYLTDFGLTKRSSSLTPPGHFIGTMDYIAPEQIGSKPVDARTDIYSLGCVLYQGLTGDPPFDRDDEAALLWAHLVERPPPVSSRRPDVPPGVDAVVAKAMAKAPEDRYRTCNELAAAFQAAIEGQAEVEPRIGPAATERPREPSGAPRRARPAAPPAGRRTGERDRSRSTTATGEHPSAPPGYAARRSRRFRLRLPTLLRRPRPRTTEELGQRQPESGDEVSFTAGYPGVVTPDTWYSLLVFVHLGHLQVQADQRIADESRGFGLHPAGSKAAADMPLLKGTLLRVDPNVHGVVFNPPAQEISWLEDLQQIAFRLQATSKAAGHTVLGAVEVHAGPLLVAQVPLSIHVRGARERRDRTEPGAAASTGRLFSSVFASYAHEDDQVVRAFAEAYRALGIDVLLDKASLRAGQNWQQTLLRLIDKADLFQLFWSEAASRSPYVAEEWRHALLLQDHKGERFIRPLYWTSPWPPPPTQLAHLHFAALDLAALSSVADRKRR